MRVLFLVSAGALAAGLLSACAASSPLAPETSTVPQAMQTTATLVNASRDAYQALNVCVEGLEAAKAARSAMAARAAGEACAAVDPAVTRLEAANQAMNALEPPPRDAFTDAQYRTLENHLATLKTILARMEPLKTRMAALDTGR